MRNPRFFPDAHASRVPCAHTYHARVRAAQRNVAANAVDYVLAWGREFHRTGAIFYFLARRDIPAAHRNLPEVARLVGMVVLTATDGQIITIYRNADAQPTIRRKLKYRTTPHTSVRPNAVRVATEPAPADVAELEDVEPTPNPDVRRQRRTPSDQTSADVATFLGPPPDAAHPLSWDAEACGAERAIRMPQHPTAIAGETGVRRYPHLDMLSA